jgi:hypothetical protein
VSVTDATTGLDFPRLDLLAAVQAVQIVVSNIFVTPAVQAFDNVKVGKQSPPQTFMVTNLGGTQIPSNGLHHGTGHLASADLRAIGMKTPPLRPGSHPIK